jgi:hypothetical protein
MNNLSISKAFLLLLYVFSTLNLISALECKNPLTTTIQQVVICKKNVDQNELQRAGEFISCVRAKVFEEFHYYCYKFDTLDPSWSQHVPTDCIARTPTCVGWFGDGSR